jgi:hypothetical protein
LFRTTHDLVEYRSKHIIGYRGRQILVHKTFLSAMRRLDTYSQATNVTVIITQSYRHPEATSRGERVPPARRSNHLAGHAVDFNIRYKATVFRFADLRLGQHTDLPSDIKAFLEMVRHDPALRWGGDFRQEDPIHIDDGLNLRNQEEWEKHAEGCLDDIVHAKPKWMMWHS